MENNKSVIYNLSLDDLLPFNTDFSLLYRLIKAFPGIKINIFIPIQGRSYRGMRNILDYPAWCEKVQKLPKKNIEFGLHGWFHHLNDSKSTPEFANLSQKEAAQLLKRCENALERAEIPFSRGFRPPGWIMSKGSYEACKELEYVYIADNASCYPYSEYEDIRIPRIFVNRDLAYERIIRPFYQSALYFPDRAKYCFQYGHFTSKAKNNFNESNLRKIVRIIKSLPQVDFRFLSELGAEMRLRGWSILPTQIREMQCLQSE